MKSLSLVAFEYCWGSHSLVMQLSHPRGMSHAPSNCTSTIIFLAAIIVMFFNTYFFLSQSLSLGGPYPTLVNFFLAPFWGPWPPCRSPGPPRAPYRPLGPNTLYRVNMSVQGPAHTEVTLKVGTLIGGFFGLKIKETVQTVKKFSKTAISPLGE